MFDRTNGGSRVEHPTPRTTDRELPGGLSQPPGIYLDPALGLSKGENHPGARERLAGDGMRDAVGTIPPNSTLPWRCT